ncbi:MAG: glycosyltransferase family 2 protein, partial [Rikenellaceae bacterium]
MLKKFLPTVVSFITTPDCEVIVADNGSTDGSLPYLQSNFPTLRVISFDRNYGFAEGYNRALHEITADYYLLLNSDVELKNDPLPPLIELLDSHPEIGAAMPKILSQQNPTMFEYAGAAGGYIDTLCFPFCRGRIIGTVEEDKGQYDTIREIFWASGAALFVRSKLYHELGGLDADFFAHMEEIDFCWRLKNAGHRIFCEPRSAVYHLGGGALNNESPFKLYLNYRNNLYMMHKNLVHPHMLIFIRMIIDGMLAVVYL